MKQNFTKTILASCIALVAMTATGCADEQQYQQGSAHVVVKEKRFTPPYGRRQPHYELCVNKPFAKEDCKWVEVDQAQYDRAVVNNMMTL